MKTNPFLVACTFLLGCLVALVAINTLREPVKAAGESTSMGASGVNNFQALTVNVDGTRSFLVVFKEVKNLLLYKVEKDEGLDDSEKVTGMAIYEIQTKGTGVGKLHLIATRYIDYDVRYYQFNSESGKMDTDVSKMKETIIGLIKSQKAYDDNPKNKPKEPKGGGKSE